jgi:drug/metabolite transporter (DMT)-like permease
MLGGYLILGIVPPLVRLAKEFQITSAELVLVRFFGATLFVLLLVRVTSGRLETRQPGLLILRGLLGACAVQLYFASIQSAGAGVGTLLNYTYPLWANLLGVVFGERPRNSFWPVLAVALVGVFLVVDPQVDGIGRGELYGLTSAVFAGGAVLSIKRLRRTDGELTIVGSFSLLGFLLAIPISLLLPSGPTLVLLKLPASALALIFAVAVLSFLGQVLFTRGYKGTSLELGSLLSLSVPTLATLLGTLFLDEALTPKFLVGGALIVIACASLGLRGPKRLDKTKQP